MYHSTGSQRDSKRNFRSRRLKAGPRRCKRSPLPPRLARGHRPGLMMHRPAGGFGHESHEYYDRHRFNNPSAWLDREDRARNKAAGQPLGYGYAKPKEPVQAREEKPFTVVEPSFTSGWMCHRKYNQFASGYATDAVRTDPYHFPNALEVKDSDHYKDQRRRTQNSDPHFWKVDPKLRDAVSDDMVKMHIIAHRGETRANIDPKVMEPLFSDNIRPQSKSVHELNVDLSCADLREHSKATPSRSRASGGSGHEGNANQEGAQHADSDWKWCLGGRKPFVRSEPTEKEAEMIRTQSLPNVLTGVSTLTGNFGGPTSPFHGNVSRKFGPPHVDPRMRGGKLARDGWAGTFPSKETRPGV
mmetsp:Transcript_135718/g.290234  ORF Transcript_135718/g.290234 Transcript_135718/m.290234 type:complete len:357 (-) Transcript_135718:104-1174(-)